MHPAVIGSGKGTFLRWSVHSATAAARRHGSDLTSNSPSKLAAVGDSAASCVCRTHPPADKAFLPAGRFPRLCKPGRGSGCIGDRFVSALQRLEPQSLFVLWASSDCCLRNGKILLVSSDLCCAACHHSLHDLLSQPLE